MFYTCADFHSREETLEEAQQHKADFILNLIDPKPGEKILELGCDWGPMLKRIHQHTGDKENLYGITLSKEQAKYNDEHNGFQVEFASSSPANTRWKSSTQFTRSAPGNTSDPTRYPNFWTSFTEPSSQVDA
jgi:hypothetical protein